jgi:hypothetical protein
MDFTTASFPRRRAGPVEQFVAADARRGRRASAGGGVTCASRTRRQHYLRCVTQNSSTAANATGRYSPGVPRRKGGSCNLWARCGHVPAVSRHLRAVSVADLQ